MLDVSDDIGRVPALSSKQEAAELRAVLPCSIGETFQNAVNLQVFFSDHGKPECTTLRWELQG